jgi:DNA-binding XRE family transcriptional regulator
VLLGSDQEVPRLDAEYEFEEPDARHEAASGQYYTTRRDEGRIREENGVKAQNNCKKDSMVLAVSVSPQTYLFIADVAARNRTTIRATASIMLDTLGASRMNDVPRQVPLSNYDGAPKRGVARCGNCGDTDPKNFYQYMKHLCKACHTAKQRRAQKMKEARLNNPALTESEIIDLCARVIRAESGIFQDELRQRLGISQMQCKRAVRALIDSGRIKRSTEMNKMGSYKLLWRLEQ